MAAYKDKKHRTWFVRFRYKDYTGRLRQTTKRGFRTKKEAQEYERDELSKNDATGDMTFSTLCDLYLQSCKSRLKISSYTATNIYVNSHIRPAFGSRKVRDIQKRDLYIWENALLHATKKNGKPYSSTTLNMITSRISSIFNFAVRYYGLPANPMHAVGLIGHSNVRKAFWTLDEFKKFICCFSKKDAPYRLAYVLLFFSGMRVGELGGLMGSDFDFERNTIHITKSFSYIAQKMTTPKTPSSVRTISMPPTIMQDVKDYLLEYNIGKSERLFTMTSRNLLWKLNQYAKRAGVPVIHVHDLRHSHASYLINNSVPITTISRRLGHISPNMTLKVYSHMYQSSAEGVADLLEHAVKKK